MQKDRLPAGNIDIASWPDLAGWAWFPDDPTRRAVLEVVHDGAVFCCIVADLPRVDLADAGIGDGRSGFALTLPRHAFNEPVVRFSVREASTGIDLRGSPLLLANDRPDVASVQALVAAFVDRWADVAGEHDALSFATFLLRQFDRLAGRHQTLTNARAGVTAEWAEALYDEGGFSPTILSHLARFRSSHGDGCLHVPTSTAPEVSVVIPVHNHFAYTYRCLVSIGEHAPTRSFEVILVDDGSSDETLLAPALVSGVRIIRNQTNDGFVSSVGTGVAAARGRWLFLLNNDTEVTPGWLDELCATLEQDPSIGVAGSKLVSSNGLLQEVGGIVWRQGDGSNWGRNADPDDPQYCYLRDADYVSGAALMIERAVWDEVGGLTPEFSPGYYEDTDLCFKVRASGRRVVVQPQSRIVHHEGISSGTDHNGGGMKRHQRINQQRFAKRWTSVLASHGLSGGAAHAEVARHSPRRALFLDDSVPTPDRDAGSNAVFEHMLSIQRLGYRVHFVPTDNMARISPHTERLERNGVRCYHRPYHRSAEEVLNETRGLFQLVYIHRAANAGRYVAMVRAANPLARVIYNVADLHFLRMQREADLSGDLGLRTAAEEMRRLETTAAASVDQVIVHSSHEAAMLASQVPGLAVSTIPWTVRPEPTPTPFLVRDGIAFIGSFNHAPNRDALGWLVGEIMPLVWSLNPSIVLSVMGSDMTDEEHALANEKVRILGWVPDAMAALHRHRVTVAPLRFGAGLKGKVLSSFAAGLPCVGTSCAMEGMELGVVGSSLVSDCAAGLAERVVRVHSDGDLNQAAVLEGSDYLAQRCSATVIDGLLAGVLAGIRKGDSPRIPR